MNMTDHIIASPRTTSLTIAANDTVLVTGTGSISTASDIAPAINSQGSAGATITILGNISNTGKAIEAVSSTVEIAGTVSATNDTAIVQLGGSNVLHNSGTINSSRLAGVEIGSSGNFGNRVVNDGTITGEIFGVRLHADGTINNNGLISGRTGISLSGSLCTVVNTGTITGTTFPSIQISDAKTTAVILNAGHLQNSVFLQNGFDFYDGRSGTIAGTLELGGGNDTAYGGAGVETFNGGSGNDRIDGGGGNDIALYFGARASYNLSTVNAVTTVADTVANRDGTDTLKGVRFAKLTDQTVVLSNAAPDSLNLSTKVLAETAQVNTPVISLSASDAGGDALTYSLVDPSGAFTLSGTSLMLARGLDYEAGARQVALTVEAKDAYGGKTSQAFTIDIANVVEENPLTLFGTAGKDTLAGENGSDKFYGGLGNDTLTGHLGQDVFVFDTKLARTNTANKRYNLDKITDFSVADETIHLKKSIFKGIAKTGLLSKGAFYASPKSTAHDASDRIVYNKNTGAVLYDQDGSGHRYEAIQIATLSTKLGLTNKDFFVI
jgi:Ca2+-binding RTX toxin-like protein